jgi:CheY-like chemotaxis protein
MPGHQRTLIPDPAGCRILVVDDEPANVLLLTRILNRAGYADVISAP